jgi:FKBP-type peptidyl-prolyl cis-trans isomerase 2
LNSLQADSFGIYLSWVCLAARAAERSQSKTIATRVREVKDKTVVVEFNHSLAGETLNFDVKVTDTQAVEA